MARNYRYETGCVSHPGRVRERNEDSYLTSPDAGLWLVADGMGGHEAGDYASGSIVRRMESIGRAASAPDLQARFLDRLVRANNDIRERSAVLQGATIGATLVALLIHEANYACIWSGDSRIYRKRGGDLAQLTRDHTEVQALLDSGTISQAQAETWPRRNVINRAIGIGDQPDTEARYGEVRPGDAFLLCSDGLTEHVSPAEIEGYLGTAPAQDVCNTLLELTLSRGAKDNVTIVVVCLHPAESPDTTLHSGTQAES